MDVRLFITGNFLCAECGWVLVPELERTANDVPTGRVFLTRHAPMCVLRDVPLIANLLQTDARAEPAKSPRPKFMRAPAPRPTASKTG